MSQPHKIALLGFSSFEKTTFESFFRLAARRPPGYALVDEPSQAVLAIINGDDTATLQQFKANRRSEHALIIGANDGGTGWQLHKRPLNLMKVLASIDAMLIKKPDAAAIVAPDVSAQRQEASAMTRSAPERADEKAPSARALANGKADRQGPDSTQRRSVRRGSGAIAPNSESPSLGAPFMHGAPKSTLTAPTDDVDHILVVDDSDIALKFMRNRLTRFGFHADLVPSGEEALERMNTKPYKFVFLDVMMEGLDGYQTCRAIKQRKYSNGKPPVVVMLTSRGGTIDRIRGTLAGCDGYLTKPLDEQQLLAILAKHDETVARGFQATNQSDSR